MEDSVFSLTENSTFSQCLFQITPGRCRRSAAQRRGIDAVGRQSEGSVLRGVEDRTLLYHSPGVLGSLSSFVCACTGRPLTGNVPQPCIHQKQPDLGAWADFQPLRWWFPFLR